LKRRTAYRSGVCRAAALGLAFVLCAGGSAYAQDAVKLSGFWIDDVVVSSIGGGRIHYEIASGLQVSRPIEALQGLRLERHPALAQAHEAIDRADDVAAAGFLKGVYADAEEPWLRGYVGRDLVGAYVRLGDADRAATVYIDMVTSGVDLYFIAEPPTDVVDMALPEVKRRVVELARVARGTVGPDRALLIQKLIDAAGSLADLERDGAIEPRAAAASGKAVVVSASVPPGPIVNLIKDGRFEQAIRSIDRSMDRPGRTASLLYLKGLAQLGIAQRDHDMDTYKSAGLDFMRVQVYFPRSAVLGPATLEAGYVHQVIGRPDIAQRLYEKAQPLIDQGEDPACHRRLTELNKAIGAGEQDE
jgi:tetratricopeptide (TPR) repeat protein